MNEGLLWYDADRRRSAQQKLDDAAARYSERFGRSVNLCQVNPNQLFAHPTIRVIGNPAVLRDHLWVGCDEEAAQPRRARASRRRSGAA